MFLKKKQNQPLFFHFTVSTLEEKTAEWIEASPPPFGRVIPLRYPLKNES